MGIMITAAERIELDRASENVSVEDQCTCDFEGPENVYTEDDAAEACDYCATNADLSHTEIYPPEMDVDMYDIDSYGVPETDVFDGL